MKADGIIEKIIKYVLIVLINLLLAVLFLKIVIWIDRAAAQEAPIVTEGYIYLHSQGGTLITSFLSSVDCTALEKHIPATTIDWTNPADSAVVYWHYDGSQVFNRAVRARLPAGPWVRTVVLKGENIFVRYHSAFDVNGDELINLSDLSYLGDYILTEQEKACLWRLFGRTAVYQYIRGDTLAIALVFKEPVLEKKGE